MKVLDWLKWTVVVVLSAMAIGGNAFYVDEPLLYRVLGVIVLGLGAIAVGAITETGGKVRVFASEATAELRRVVWPTRSEVQRTTLLVMVVVAIVGLLLWGMDALVGWLVSLLLG